MKNLLYFAHADETKRANLHGYKKIIKWMPFWTKVYDDDDEMMLMMSMMMLKMIMRMTMTKMICCDVHADDDDEMNKRNESHATVPL